MSEHLITDFSIDKENKTIIVKKEYDADLQSVWDAYTKNAILDQWWAPKPWKARTKTMDFSEGGFWHYAMAGPEGEEHWAMEQYKTIEPLKRFTARDSFADAEGVINEQMPQSNWEVKFSEKDGRTLVETISTFDKAEDLEKTIEMGFEEGYKTAMKGLDELFAYNKVASSVR